MIVRTLLIVCLVAVLGGCSSDDERIAEHLQRAKQFVDAGERQSAIIELKNALQIDGETAEARQMLGRLYLQAGNGPAAAKELAIARRLGRNDDATLLDLAKAHAVAGDLGSLRGLLDELPAENQGLEWYLLRAEAALGRAPGDPPPDAESMHSARQWFERARQADPNDPRAARGLARLAVLRGDPDAAFDILASATAGIGKTDLQSWLLKGELELSRGDYEAARTSFTTALGLDGESEHPLARLGLARALLATGDAQGAAPYIDALLASQPRSAAVQFLNASRLRLRNQNDEALAAVREALARDPNHGPSLLLGGQLHFRAGEFSQAEDLVRRHLMQHPDSTTARQLLASVLLEQRRPEEAIELLKTQAESTPEDPRLMALLGSAHMQLNQPELAQRYLDRAAAAAGEQQTQMTASIQTQQAVNRLASGDTEGAIETLRAAVDQHPDFARAEVLLLLAQLRQGDTEQARLQADSLLQKYPKQATAHNLKGVVEETAGDREAARHYYQGAVELAADYAPARLNLARLAILENDVPTAERWLNEILEADPNNAQALLALANLDARRGDEQSSLRKLEQARQHNRNALRPRLVLGNFHLLKGDPVKALQVIREAVAIAPRDAVVKSLLARALLAGGEPERALEAVQSAIELRPKDATLLLQRGQIQASQQQLDAARASLEQALSIAPDLQAARIGLARLAIAARDYDRASDLTREVAQALPDAAIGSLLMGEIQIAQGRPETALEHYTTAYERAASSDTLVRLANLEVSLGQTRQAAERLSVWLQQHPQDAAARRVLASIRLRDGDLAAAASLYEQILEVNPTDSIALNNLAWAYDQLGDERALGLAERAYAQTPDRAEVADTLGWMLVRADQLERGLALLDKAAAKAPHNSDIRYHLAAARAKTGDLAGAREELELILSRAEDFSEKPRAEALLHSLK
ncbi:MAG: PEP-CTERM system TPR-repeat protein PrsT [Gammaproteobacteria bacterium]|nr:PEP-CTERM system TPR-repeat protein PrsT [Gammaproteobacteria bacterium]